MKILLKVISVPSTKLRTSVSTLRKDRKQHISLLKSELFNLSPYSKSWWRLVKSISGICSPSIPSLTSNGRTADSAFLNLGDVHINLGDGDGDGDVHVNMHVHVQRLNA